MKCSINTSMFRSMTNSMLKLLYLSRGTMSLNRMIVPDILLTLHPEVTGLRADPRLNTVDIVPDSPHLVEAEGVVRGGQVPGTLPRFLPVPNVPELAAPGDHKLGVGVAHPGVPAMDQGVGDGVGPQLVEVDHPHPVILLSRY